MRRLVVVASSLLILAGPAAAKGCRIPDPKPGQPLQVPAECKDSVRPRHRDTDALRSDPGAIDLGNGTTVRIGGRIRAETGWRR